jgi:type VI protein secretion system component Hcp
MTKNRAGSRMTPNQPAETDAARGLELTEDETATAAGGLSLNFSKIEWEYKPQDEKGGLGG